MKTLIATLALMMAPSTPAQAEQASCEQIAELAESIMDARQSGLSVVDAMGASGGSAMIERMIIEAYESHRYKAEIWQTGEIADFRDKWFLYCYKSMKGE